MPRDYSATPLPRKLGIKEASRVRVLGAPEGFSLGVEEVGEEPFDVVLFFTTTLAELERRFAALARSLSPAGGLWIAWPKKSSRIDSDLAFADVQRIGLEAGLVDNKSCAVDERWQAVRFVYRLRDRRAAGPGRGSG